MGGFSCNLSAEHVLVSQFVRGKHGRAPCSPEAPAFAVSSLGSVQFYSPNG